MGNLMFPVLGAASVAANHSQLSNIAPILDLHARAWGAESSVLGFGTVSTWDEEVDSNSLAKANNKYNYIVT